MPERHAIIDMGSNTVRLVIFEVEGDDIKIALNKKVMAGLVGYVEEGVLTDAGIERACEVLTKQLDGISLLDVDSVSVFSTAVLRNIANTEDACNRIEAATGVHVDVLSGKEEARLGYVGCSGQIEGDRGIVLDIGGGSTEITVLEPDKDPQTASLPFGSLFLYLRFVSDILPTRGEAEMIWKFVDSQVSKLDILGDKGFPEAIGLGGSARAIAKLVDEFVGRERTEFVELDQMNSVIELLSREYRETMHAILRICPDRIHTVIPGMLAFEAIMSRAGSETLKISKHGVREGYLLEKVLGRDTGGKSKGNSKNKANSKSKVSKSSSSCSKNNGSDSKNSNASSKSTSNSKKK
ncbi:MAG: hypothetical protein ACOYIK_03370 [Coriobacteriales bacterium]|jgi:exopolyphosphatase/guanosine-5'-triphosphate,3'-diphosphate pyrophosphatase